MLMDCWGSSLQFVPLPVTGEAIARETRRDPVLVRVHESIVKGWSARVDGDKPYFYGK